jgi:AraC-like DNA-binding protein
VRCAAMSVNEQIIRRGMALHWGPGVFDPRPFAGVAQALFIFSLADDAPEFPRSQMLFADTHVNDLSLDALATPSFHAAVILSQDALRDWLATDDSVAARRLREIGRGEIVSMMALPLTPAARFAAESIRRCPFAGVCREMALGARCNDLLVEFMTAIATTETPNQPALTRAVHDRIHLAAEWLKRGVEETPALADLARRVGLSESTLKRGFHQVFGATVFGYLRQQRMERARALLQSGEATVLEAAARVGYSNPSNFAAAFRRQFGVNPKTFQLTARR